jgi:hypothetical protein
LSARFVASVIRQRDNAQAVSVDELDMPRNFSCNTITRCRSAEFSAASWLLGLKGKASQAKQVQQQQQECDHRD